MTVIKSAWCSCRRLEVSLFFFFFFLLHAKKHISSRREERKSEESMLALLDCSIQCEYISCGHLQPQESFGSFYREVLVVKIILMNYDLIMNTRGLQRWLSGQERLVLIAGNRRSILSTHFRWLPATFNSGSRGSSPFFWTLGEAARTFM